MMNTSQQKGVVLIEALIGILIFSIGILALIGLQAVAIKNTVDSQNRIEAGFLVNEIVSRMWTTNANPSTYAFSSGTPSNTTLQTWVTKVGNTMPGVNSTAFTTSTGTGTSPSIALTGNRVTVTVYWKAPGEATSAAS